MSSIPDELMKHETAIERILNQMVQGLQLIVAPGQVVELRALEVQSGYGKPHVEAGFFDSDHLREMATAALRVTPRAKGVYFSLNPVNTDLLARRCYRIDRAGDGELTKDKDILKRTYMLVDADPIRDALVSATDQEKAAALDTICEVRSFLRSRGWPDPILADSGNGYHLLYPIDLPTEDGDIVKRNLLAIAARFDSDFVKIDKTVHNAARICKLPGTLARKGDNTPSRPHRQARILEIPTL